MKTAEPPPAAAVSAGKASGREFRHGDRAVEAGRFLVPPVRDERRRLAALVAEHAAGRGLIAPLCRTELEAVAGAMVKAYGLDPRVREYLMVLLHNEVWRDIVAAVPFKRRTLLLPPCLRHSARCPARFDEFGLLCERCGSCVLGRLGEEAEALGYAVLIAEGTSVVAKLIEQGMIDAVIGVSCMPSLERAFAPVSDHAVPGLAIPLILEGCRDTETDIESVRESLRLEAGGGYRSSLADLTRLGAEVRSWFAEEALRSALRPTGTQVEEIALEWLSRAGKRWRPLLSVCVYQALAGGAETEMPAKVRSVALAVECIHKASLIYDDVQDEDERRYGQSTVHRVHGVPVALTASLFLLGQGYRLLADCDAPAAERAAMLSLAAGGHCRLCLGQGGELWWMRHPSPLTGREVLDIFRLKTAPSFDVVFRLGAICAGAEPPVHAVLERFSEIVGVAYQVQDDLDDFSGGGDVDDVNACRPGLVLALAHEHAQGAQRQAVESFWMGRDGVALAEVREVIAATGAEKCARAILAEWKQKALESLQPLRNRDLKILLHRLVARIFREP